MRYIEMHRGPAAYVLGPPPSRSRDLELEGGVIACHVDYVFEDSTREFEGMLIVKNALRHYVGGKEAGKVNS